ncbi:MAG TPA: Gfo/Idh/MocA family oxidoreductase [Kiritimatiellia bacterium]|jgi:predicted dehydrogenase|nr:Gfo/Idh/MocA family oxidoreductase [Kiritimatiellia bacterium]HPW76269.1 Gfo/Idh/MocA family oxidoreductase [Kiritimatiellia bacterium]HRU19230.1 Gfo/Idh/MocA family oxidoreductase [Kiritimatiellia bacterium]
MIRTTRPPIRVGLVGLGRAGLEMHVPELEQYPELFKIIAVCDPVKERRDLAVERIPECRTYRRYEDLLADPDVELVDIATRSDEHAAHGMQALKTDKWVNMERPFCRDYDEALVLRAAAIKASNRLLVRHNYRFEPAFMQVREVIESGVLGELYDIKIRRGVYERRDDWQTVKRCGGGAALAWGTAFLDQALELLRTPPIKVWSDFKRVASVGDAEDYVRIILRNMAGLTVDLEVSGGRIGEMPQFIVTGTKGAFTLYPDAEQGTLRYLDPKQKLARRRSSVRTPPLGSFGTAETLQWLETSVPVKPKAECGMSLIWKYVYQAIRENKPYPVPLDVAIETMRILSLVKKESPFA